MSVNGVLAEIIPIFNFAVPDLVFPNIIPEAVENIFKGQMWPLSLDFDICVLSD